MDEFERAQVMGQMYAAGAVDLERRTGQIGFERKPVRADVHRSSAAGGQGAYIGGIYARDGECRAPRPMHRR